MAVESGLDKTLDDLPQHALARLALSIPDRLRDSSREPGLRQVACFHCGEPCPEPILAKGEKQFCCHGCLAVHDLLAEHGLEQFYDLSVNPGVRVVKRDRREEWAYLDDVKVQRQLLDFSDGKVSRVRLRIPAVHCVACVWLLENLFRLADGIGRCEVDFARREVAICYEAEKISLSQLVSLLASIGYEPELTLGELEARPKHAAGKRQWLQIGIAGFAFGNIMLFSLPVYLGLDSLSGPFFTPLFGYLSLLLAAPVLVYSAADYWRTALLCLRQRMLRLDVPIALGLAALYAQSTYEIIGGHGAGYLDSLAGLVFFLLCGRVFQQRTHDRLIFDRDYKSFFPLSVTRQTSAGPQVIALPALQVGDRVVLRNRELIPADARLVTGPALIDYSFVTGESEPVPRQAGDYVYAGGQQIGAAVAIETVKAVSQSYLTSLWNQEAFQKKSAHDLDTLTNRYSRRFTLIVVAIALGAALCWTLAGEPARAIKAFASVLIVACPCALALAAPFALGTAQRLLAPLLIFLKNPFVLERLAQIDTIVFDKTGTLTAAQDSRVSFVPGASRLELSTREMIWVCSLAGQSVHPKALQTQEHLLVNLNECSPSSSSSSKHGMPGLIAPDAIEAFREIPGGGISGRVQGHSILLGSGAWLEECGIAFEEANQPSGSASYLAIDGHFRGAFSFSNPPRPEIDHLLGNLSEDYELILLSGDKERGRDSYRKLFGPKAELHFSQTPFDKLRFIRALQEAGKMVMMVGDGLNDAGALKQSHVGVAVVERVGLFSPASDIILPASQLPRLTNLLALARKAVRVVQSSFAISAFYNLAGVSIAAAGILSPLICAILMPLSSITVVLFACGLTTWATRTVGLSKR
ncbi:MAG TPA: heavy metal translocating P-type ATPase metal-binding domain-containing protein [Candidatus Limnocylindrales bacterium]|jgi:Cu+-exporting ATPase|nr:heavy metal translocating P-type ATPase metal-binding domain-containing protein [Candidatus Limnocylindrales bacterium]